MFSRRKPPQLSVYDELQQTHSDSYNLTHKYLSLEEQNRVEESLRGWKSLHTSLLFKIELFEKLKNKMSADELAVLRDLKTLRDQNVRHLIRMQLRVDEVARKNGANHTRNPTAASTAASTENVRSLRVAASTGSKTQHNTSNVHRSMRKSLRPGAASLSHQAWAHKAPRPTPGDVPRQASQAANLSWQQPPLQRSRSYLDPHADTYPENKAASTTERAADISDEDSFEFDDHNWEKIANEVVTPDLIDLDGAGDEMTFPITHSMEDLTLRASSPPEAPGHEAAQSLKPPSLTLDHVSKSTSDIRADRRKYTYKQPKPIDMTRLMKKPGAAQKAAVAAPTRAAATATRAKQSSRPVAKATAGQARPPSNHVAKTALSSGPPGRSPGALDDSESQPPTEANPPASSSQPPKKGGTTYHHVKPNSQNAKKTASARNAAASSEGANNKREQAAGSIEGANGNSGVMGSDGSGVAAASESAEQERSALIASIRGIDTTAAHQILNDVVVRGDDVYWDDIVGLEGAKNSLKEAVVYPFLRPDLFQGLREPTRGMLLFGPPGTGKTMLARAVATESKSTFFSITASSLTSKYLGESEKLVRALFLLARKLSPSIVFIDEIDSLLGSRTEGEVESTRRIKNEFLVQWSELSSAAAGRDRATADDRVLVLGATNLPWMIDEAARRRFARRQYIPLPADDTRKHQIMKLLQYQNHGLSAADYTTLIDLTRGFSGSDVTALAKDSAMGPLRSLGDQLLSTPTELIRPIKLDDFISSLRYIRPSVSSESLEEYERWAARYGSSGV